MPAPPLVAKRRVIAPSNSQLPLDQVILGECTGVLDGWPDSCIDLVYLDPPFNTGKAMIGDAGRYADRWDDMNAYLAFMRPCVLAIHRVLRPSGSILLHCDWRTCHHFRLMLDEVFGAANFVNHLIWSYGLGGSSPRRFARKHDDILFYGRTDQYHFDPPQVAATSVRMRGQLKKATDVLDVPSINNMAAERTGYPTQKPLELLTMLVGACCPMGGITVDPFCGSGTSLVAAKTLGRRFVGIDRNPDAVTIARSRLSADAAAAAAKTD